MTFYSATNASLDVDNETAAEGSHFPGSNTSGSMLEPALSHAKRGFHVFPCDPTNKRPLTQHGFKDSTIDPAQIRAWWQRWPRALIGVSTGAASGFFAIDLDKPKKLGGPDGVSAFENLADQHGGIPETPIHMTPNGGLHMLFKWDPERPVTNSTGELPLGIDVRGEGGYIIVPPSKLADGRAYKCVDPAEYGDPACALNPADAPEWLYDLILAPKRQPASERIKHRSDGETMVHVVDFPPEADFFTRVNRAALDDIEAWAPRLFPTAAFQPGTGAWRIASKDLGRDLEEDLSIHPDGIQDFGPRSGMTPIDVVIEWGCAPTAKAAALWLCKVLEIDPASLGLRAERHGAEEAREAVEGWRKPSRSSPVISTAHDLRSRVFADPKFAVGRYIPEGATILAGNPKVGKSWLVLQIGLAVADGTECLGEPCEQGDVLYLALEDNERRLQQRISRLRADLGADWPKTFHYSTGWRRGDEGIKDIREWAKQVERPRLVIIDVLAMFRAEPGRRDSSYESDYNAIKILQALASELGLAIVIVHHTRKVKEQSDPFEKVSGTLGLSGGADTILILSRDSNGTTLYGRGRDIEEIETSVQFDRETCLWQVLGEAGQVRQSDERKKILTALKDAGEPMSPKDLELATGMPGGSIRQLLFKMAKDGEVLRDGRGKYKHPGQPFNGSSDSYRRGRDGDFVLDDIDFSNVPYWRRN